jgi:predicted HAD superfamily phosphohydrolase
VIARLSADGYEVFSITTTYEQYAQRVAQRLRLALTRLACTSFPLEKFSARLRTADMSAVANIESSLRQLDIENEEERLGELLDAFYWQELPGSPMGEAVASVRPVGGKRKLGALGRFAAATQLDLSDWVVVGDSITDNAMLTGVRDATGLSVAFNGNRYALECGTVGVASTSLGDLVPLLRAWEKGRLEGARDFVSRATKDPEAPGPHYHWLDSADIADAVAVHGRFRRLVREDAAGLG